MEITSNFHDDFFNIIFKRIECLKSIGFKFIEYNAWKTKKVKSLEKIIEQKENHGEDANFERKMLDENMLNLEYRRDIVHHYYNLSYKIPMKKPRKIFKCSGFICPEKLQIGLKELENKIIRGDDLLPNLSRDIFDPTCRDYMLYDFGIYHFHLGVKPLKDNQLLLKSTNELLFALFDNESCYFIQIGNHNQFDDISLLTTLKRDFPKTLDKWKVNAEPVIKLKGSERKELIKNCVNTLLEIDGEYYMSPGMGVNTAGTSSLAVMNMNRSINYFINLQDYVKQIVENDICEIEKSLNKILTNMHLILQEIDPVIIYDPYNNIQFLIKNNGNNLSMEIRNSV
jgi:hypothetical protein